MPIRLGELLLSENMISAQQLQEALNYQKARGGKLAGAIVSLGFLKDEAITSLLSRQYGVPSISLDHFEVDPRIIKIIPAETARKFQVLPLSLSGATLTLAMADPTNVFAMDDIKFMTGYNVEPVVASESAVEDAIDRYYGSPRPLRMEPPKVPAPRGALDGPTLSGDDLAAIGGLSEIDFHAMEAESDVETAKSKGDEIDLGNLAKSADAAPVLKLANVLLVDSLKRGASDIHIEPYEKEFRVRFRIDGVLYNVMALPMKLRDPLISRIKVMARLDIAEKRLPQDGRIKIIMKIEDRSLGLDFRVSVRPTRWGEKIVLRRLDKSKLMLDMARLGFEPHSLERFRNAIARTSGMVLVTGPQRSGRTTTLYSAIASLNRPETNVMTVEDPVELDLPGTNQVAINRAAGETAATVLRSLQNVDSDVVLVGEMADAETARLAFDLAQQGPLVLSTLSTSDAVSTVAHLLNVGIDPYRLATTVHAIVAQRLVRRICTKCRVDVTAEVPSKTLIDMGFSPDIVGTFQLMKGRGCGACNGTGYRGSVGLFEILQISEGIRELIATGGSPVEILRRGLEEGMLTLRMSGLEKIKNGVTTVEEVLRETVLWPIGVAPPSIPMEPARAMERAEDSRAAPLPDPGLRIGSRSLPERAEGFESAGTPESLAAQLASANAEIERLRQRLLELSCSDILVVQLANAKTEIETLRERLFELNSYRTAYERLLGDQPRPPLGNA